MNNPLLANTNPPPPGATLLSAVEKMKPVRTRVPALVLALLVGVGCITPVFALWKGVRVDLAFLPIVWVVLMAAVWAAGAALPLYAAVVPPRGEVLPDTARAGRFAFGAAAVLLLLGLFTTVNAPGHTFIPAQAFDSAWRHCITFGLRVTVPVLLVSLLLLRRSLPVGGLTVAAAVGAGAGALAGLTLHFICSIGGGLHVGLAHAGGVVVGAVLGMLTLPRFLKN